MLRLLFSTAALAGATPPRILYSVNSQFVDHEVKLAQDLKHELLQVCAGACEGARVRVTRTHAELASMCVTRTVFIRTCVYIAARRSR